jgi:hypothetical protein
MARKNIYMTSPSSQVFLRMCKYLFSRGEKTPLQKLMVTVNRGSSSASKDEKLMKKVVVELTDHNILQLENQRAHIKLLEEACKDIIDDVRQSNHAKKTDIPQMMVTRLDQIGKELGGIENAILTGLSTLQDLHFGFVPMEEPKETPTPKKQEAGKRTRG